MYVYATSRSTFATSKQNTRNIYLEQMKHLEHTLETYVYSHYNMCNISIFFCNINIQHFQHTSETSETLEIYSYNMRFSPFLLRTTQHRAGERPIPVSRRPRTVERPDSGQLRLRLAWARPVTATSPGRLATRGCRRLHGCCWRAGAGMAAREEVVVMEGGQRRRRKASTAPPANAPPQCRVGKTSNGVGEKYVR
jgi:hypothetical protein